jgi:hypothetical protein
MSRREGGAGSLALAKPLPQLLALGGELFEERRAEAFARAVPVDHDTVGFLEALRQGFACYGQ